MHRHLPLDAAQPPHGSRAGKPLQAGQGRRRRLFRTRPGRLLVRVGIRARPRRLARADDPQPGRDAGARFQRTRHHAPVHGQGRLADLGTRRLVALRRLAAAQCLRTDFDAGRTDRRDGGRVPGRATAGQERCRANVCWRWRPVHRRHLREPELCRGAEAGAGAHRREQSVGLLDARDMQFW